MLFRIHNEGRTILVVAALLLFALNIVVAQFLSILFWPVLVLSVGFYILVLQFFRNPVREIPVADNHLVYAPADGRVCVIEEVFEAEYFKEKRLQISIFMSPLNVHVNRNPVSGVVNYFRYHPGKYLVAWHPKSSTENERTTIVVENRIFGEILYRQIAGALARRIVNYAEEGMQVRQGTDAGFIKFGSRVDLFLPLGTNVTVSLNQKAVGGKTIIASKEA